VQQARLLLSGRGGSVVLQLTFQPMTIPAGGSANLSLTWQFSTGDS
jgi:hypothetical protein